MQPRDLRLRTRLAGVSAVGVGAPRPTASVSASLAAAVVAALAFLLAGCGSKTGLSVRPPRDGGPVADGGMDAALADGGFDAGHEGGTDGPFDAPFDAGLDGGPDVDGGCVPVDDRCRAAELCNNGLDDDCNGAVDDGCTCTAGDVEACFPGPPGRRGIGACVDGTQTCLMTSTWGPCEGGIGPQPDVCNGTDNLCNGCSAQRDCPILCPTEGDPRVPEGMPFADYPLRGRDFYTGAVRSFRWTVQGGPCDCISSMFSSFTLTGANRETATFRPLLSGDYTVHLRVVTAEGTTLSCDWVVHVRGPGLRIEMCYRESDTQDFDRMLKQPGHTHAVVREHDDRPTDGERCGSGRVRVAQLRGDDPRLHVDARRLGLHVEPPFRVRRRPAWNGVDRARLLREPTSRRRQQPRRGHRAPREHQRRRATRG